MIVIADASPLRYLVLIEEVHVLPQLFGSLVVPTGVMSELSQPDTPLPVQRWIERPPDWISVHEPTAPLMDLPQNLGRGECEAIALAQELHADALLVDDGAARSEAVRRGIPIQGTLRILDLADEHGFSELSVAIRKLEATNFRASPRLIQFFLQRAAARRH